jgi:hypothetical protein
MPDPRNLLICLLDYIKEQAKQINPEKYRLANAKGFLRYFGDIAGLPGVEFDIKLAGDHVWLRIPRLVAEPPPAPAPVHNALLRSSADPNGPPPSIDEAALARQINQRLQSARARKEPTETAKIEAETKVAAAQALSTYSASWTRWAIGERPRRQTIALYGDLFTLMHQMEAEQTSKPQELIWGIGISSWLLKTEKVTIPFEYPLLTQAMELSIDEQTMAIEIRPRATDTNVEFDAFVACQVSGSIEVERNATAQLLRQKDRPTTPFDPGSYSDVLKLIAGNLDSEGQYREVLNQNGMAPPAAAHLVVTDAWTLLSRPRTINFLFEDLKRLQD